MKNRIAVRLNFEKTLSAVAGNPNGREAYDNQAKEIVENGIKDETNMFDIIIPEQITSYSGSFFQGFFFNPVRIIGVSNVKKRFSIIAPGIKNETSEAIMAHIKP